MMTLNQLVIVALLPVFFLSACASGGGPIAPDEPLGQVTLELLSEPDVGEVVLTAVHLETGTTIFERTLNPNAGSASVSTFVPVAAGGSDYAFEAVAYSAADGTEIGGAYQEKTLRPGANAPISLTIVLDANEVHFGQVAIQVGYDNAPQPDGVELVQTGDAIAITIIATDAQGDPVFMIASGHGFSTPAPVAETFSVPAPTEATTTVVSLLDNKGGLTPVYIYFSEGGDASVTTGGTNACVQDYKACSDGFCDTIAAACLASLTLLCGDIQWTCANPLTAEEQAFAEAQNLTDETGALLEGVTLSFVRALMGFDKDGNGKLSISEVRRLAYDAFLAGVTFPDIKTLIGDMAGQGLANADGLKFHELSKVIDLTTIVNSGFNPEQAWQALEGQLQGLLMTFAGGDLAKAQALALSVLLTRAAQIMKEGAPEDAEGAREVLLAWVANTTFGFSPEPDEDAVKALTELATDETAAEHAQVLQSRLDHLAANPPGESGYYYDTLAPSERQAAWDATKGQLEQGIESLKSKADK